MTVIHWSNTFCSSAKKKTQTNNKLKMCSPWQVLKKEEETEQQKIQIFHGIVSHPNTQCSSEVENLNF